MKSKKIFLVIVTGFLLVLLLMGCVNEPEDKEFKDITDLYTLTENADNTYSYSLTDVDGNLLFEKQNSVKEPKIETITPDVYGLVTQTGTGLSTNWAVYCDVKNSKVSETFYYVLAAQGDYVICADYENGKHSIIVQNMFDKSAYFKTYELENVSPVAADFIIDCKFDVAGNATVTYLTGEDYTEAEITINIS
ncbi:MAG: hypothetical protein IJ447_03605 [Clostridia bacterium]|nr:hypothetical protein [Clostridia bacterium]